MQHKSALIRLSVIVALLSVLMVVGPVLAQGGTVVRVEPATVTATIGQSFAVSIKVDNATNLAAYEVHLSFNSTILQVAQTANGGFVAADFVAQNMSDNGIGTVDYAVAQINKAPVNGNGTLVTINFTAIAAGTSQIQFRATPAAPTGVILSDPNGMAIAVTLQSGTVTVNGGPTPTFTATPTVGPTPTFTATPTQGPTPTFTATPTQGASPTPISQPILGNHTVKYGESLYCIGRAYGVSPWAIAQVNAVPWPYGIFPNQVLKIPNSAWVNPPFGPVCQRQFGTIPATATPAPVSTPVPTTCRVQYAVVWGDTLYAIAARYNSTVWVIAQMNHIWNINLIYPGQVLCIP